MKYITGFFMAWGNFCSIPCPCKKWDNESRTLMLGFLPSVGLIIGLIWALVYFAAVWLSLPFMAVSFITVFMPYILCGFMHLDGFMDCTDAIMSRRPVEEKQRILKDSHTGAFAVIAMVFLALAAFAFISTAVTSGIDFVTLVRITVISRTFSGLQVLCLRPLGTSQYADMSQLENNKKGLSILGIQCVIYIFLALFFSASEISTIMVILSVAAANLISVTYARKKLGGMSGDIAGYGIVWGELAGMTCLMFC